MLWLAERDAGGALFVSPMNPALAVSLEGGVSGTCTCKSWPNCSTALRGSQVIGDSRWARPWPTRAGQVPDVHEKVRIKAGSRLSMADRAPSRRPRFSHEPTTRSPR